MRKIFTLLAAVMIAGMAYAESVTATWTLGVAPADVVTSAVTSTNSITGAMTVGSALIDGKKRTAKPSTGDVAMTSYKTNATKGYQDGEYIDFTITPAQGMQFAITNISLSIGSVKSSSARSQIQIIADGQTTQVAKEFTPTRVDENAATDKDANRSYGKSYNITDMAASDKAVVVRVLIYESDANSREVSMSNVVITGDLIDTGDHRTYAPISWNVESTKLKVRDAFTAPVLNNEENLAVTFESSNPELATVNEAGVISLVEGQIGTAIITATYTGDETSKYKTTTESTTITVNTNVVDKHAWAPYEAPAELAVDELYMVPKKSGSFAPAALIDDENVKIETVFSADYTIKYPKTYLGHNFTGALQAGRVDLAPTADNKTGTEKAGNSPIVVTPAKDLKLVMFVRRQALEQADMLKEEDDVENNVITRTHYWGMSENDGKGVYAVAQSDIETKLPQQLVFGAYMNATAAGSNDYLCAAVIWELKANETYTIWTRGTTICMHGVGYILPEAPVAPEAPALAIESVDFTDATIDLGGKNKTITFKAAEGLDIYYNFEKATAAPNDPTEEEEPGLMTLAETDAPKTIEHEGKTYTIVPAEGLTLTEAGTLSYFAHDPATDLKSEVKTLAVTGNGDTTGIDEIGVDNAAAPVEYFNLQGIRVDNPANGVFIRRQGNKVDKVIM